MKKCSKRNIISLKVLIIQRKRLKLKTMIIFVIQKRYFYPFVQMLMTNLSGIMRSANNCVFNYFILHALGFSRTCIVIIKMNSVPLKYNKQTTNKFAYEHNRFVWIVCVSNVCIINKFSRLLQLYTHTQNFFANELKIIKISPLRFV